ncbi:MAG TPA: lysylphosphatidylglycerol synthase transmembrane domain-containing protein [Gemmatimonadaceae bacterium]|nr:lysylphosphatidylglycerol synthase transmembrane domain-containing protein [Gemmatimonadaceae bacterium]
MTHPPASIRRSGRLLALLALAGLIAVAVQRMDLSRAAAQLTAVRGQWLLLAIACYAMILPLWAWQWRLLSPRTPNARPRDMLGVVALTSSVLNTTPLLVGEATAVVLLVTRAGLDRPAALSVLAMDQLLVGVAKLCVLALAAVVAPLPEWMTRAVLGLLASLLLLGAALVVAAWRHADVEGALAHVVPRRFAAGLGAFARSLDPLRSVARGFPALGLALLKKAAEVAAIMCVHRAFGLPGAVAAAIVVLAVLNVATLLPVVPGNVGVFEAAVVLALTRFGLTPELALGVAIVQHLCYFVALALPGLLSAARRG